MNLRVNSVYLAALIGLTIPLTSVAQEELATLKTIAESSEYLATCRYEEGAEFVDLCATAPHVERINFGESVEGRDMIGALVANPAFETGTDDDRLRILLLGNIHSGECAGKEALLAMLRELALDPDHPWLKDSVIMIVPNYNVDANERIGLGQRPGQVGPAQGMGQRANAQQLDLNRDFVKIESPEARSLVALIDGFDPHMFIDCHTTNGSRHQYVLTYDIPHNPTSPQAIRDFLRNNMMPAVTQALEEKDVLTFYYGNFRANNSQWVTYGHEPRYSTEYVGLRGRLGILSEAYSYASYRDRIEGTDAFVRQCIEHVRANAADVKQLLADVRQRDIAAGNDEPAATLIHLDSRMVPFDGTFTVRGYDGDEPQNYEVTFIGNFQPVTSVSMPYAYVIPAEMSLHAERLQMHGAQVERIPETVEVDATVYRVSRINRSSRTFQRHNMVNLEATSRREIREIPTGSFLVRTAQPLGRLVSYMLEPETNEGLVTWNFLDPWLSEGADYPILRLDTAPAFATELVNEITPGGKLRLPDIFGPEKIQLAEVSLDDVQWLEGGRSYSIEKNGRRIAIDVESGAESRLPIPFDLDEVADALRDIEGMGRRDLMEILAAGIQLRGEGQKLFLLEKDQRTIVYDADSKSALELGTDEAPAELAELNPEGTAVAFVSGNNLMLLEQGDRRPAAVTSDGSESLLNGKLDWVYQEELYGRGNFKAFWWSPDGKAIAFLQTDESPVQQYTVTDHLPVRGELEVTAYPKAGDPLPIVRVAVYGVETNRTAWAELPLVGQPEGLDQATEQWLISRVTWDPTDQTLLLQMQDRIQSRLDLYRMAPYTGELKLVLRDKTDAWIRSPGDPVILDDGSFLWLSPRSGYNAIYRYAADGKELAQLTSDKWEVRQLLGCDFENELVYFTGSPDTPTRVTGMSVKLDGSNLKNLLDMPGNYDLKFNDDFSYSLARHSTVVDPEHIHLFKSDGSLVRHVIPNLDDRLKHLAVREPEFLTVEINEEGDSGVMDAMLFKPLDFDPEQQYPVLVHVYGGPQAPRVRDRFAGQTYLWHQYLTQQGYVVFVVDNQSCSYRSVKQAWPVYRDMARNELADLEVAVSWLKRNHDWVDANRIGLWGWSYGGYMTAYAMTHSKTFKAGIAGAPVTDWKNYDAIYTERYMDTPQRNPDGYASSSVLPAAENLHGQLLLIHGTVDDNVHISNTMQLVHALQKAGKQFELMVYPANRHSVRDPQQRLHLYQLMTDFLQRNL